jgi:hypothetical protein
MREGAMSTAVVGSYPAQIMDHFAPTVWSHLRKLQSTGGDYAVYKFLWSLSAFQLYEFEHVYNESYHPAGVPTSLISMVLYGGILRSPHAALSRVMSANLTYNSIYYGPTVPGGRRAVQKIGTIAGFPAQTTLYEVWLEYATMPGVTIGESAVMAISDFAGPIAAFYFGGYAVGTAISWGIQTFAPGLQRALGDLEAATLADMSLVITTDAQLMQAIQLIDVMGSPGLNEVDFDGFQIGAVTTAELMPD